MRRAVITAGLLVSATLAATQAHADPRSIYVTMVLQAFAAKVECPGTDVVYQPPIQRKNQGKRQQITARDPLDRRKVAI